MQERVFQTTVALHAMRKRRSVIGTQITSISNDEGTSSRMKPKLDGHCVLSMPSHSHSVSVPTSLGVVKRGISGRVEWIGNRNPPRMRLLAHRSK